MAPRSRDWFKRAILLTAFAFAPGCRPTPAPPPVAAANTETLDALLTLMRQRLALMHDVAKWKWNERKPIADPVRERELLDAVAARGVAKGLEEPFVRAFFAAQIDAAKEMQQADTDRWNAAKQGRFADAVDLASIRVRIDDLNGKLLDALAAGRPTLRSTESQAALKERAAKILTGDGIEASVRETAIRALRD